MDSKVYLDEKVRQAHYQELLREAEKSRLLAQLPRHRRSVSRDRRHIRLLSSTSSNSSIRLRRTRTPLPRAPVYLPG